MFYGTKDSFEKQKREYLITAQRLWMVEPFYFKSSDYYNRVIRTVTHLEIQIKMNCLTWKGGEEILKYKNGVMKYQQAVISNNKIYSTWLGENQYRNERSVELYRLFSKIIGFLSGFGQVGTGVGICVSTAGSAAIPGVSMIVQGLNNIYENGYYLVAYEEVSGPLREAYRYTASKAGYDRKFGDMAYSTIDLALSGYGVARKIPTPRDKSWSLFGIKLHQTDYTRGIVDMTKPVFMLDIISDEITVLSLMPAYDIDDLEM
ncbi:DUF4225 domain-containing protein [Citrobacter sp. XY323]|uniref:DUF4225 domain-containing protein n=1 Tax=Citrobacter sp. XY323 TaxID=2976537 RepID=UPI0021821EDC|nr:DUF4225 domain-containing protein [Citrobacter sp. XY323]MCS8552358.1 DUF4225 domain-containing protein [Citrobacter sp. XY323]